MGEVRFACDWSYHLNNTTIYLNPLTVMEAQEFVFVIGWTSIFFGLRNEQPANRLRLAGDALHATGDCWLGRAGAVRLI